MRATIKVNSKPQHAYGAYGSRVWQSRDGFEKLLRAARKHFMMLSMNNLLRFLGLCAALGLLATSCTSIEPRLPEPQPATIPIDPALYNLSGLLSADEVLENTFRKLRDIGISPVTADEVDAYQDRQEARWREVLAGTDLKVFRIDDYLYIRMPSRTIFLMESADLDPAAFSVLESMSAVFNEFGQSVIEIAAHTDDRDSPSYNRYFSSRRARSLASFLEARNVNSARIIEAPAGATHSVGDETTAAGRDLNRRIEVTLVPFVTREVSAILGIQ